VLDFKYTETIFFFGTYIHVSASVGLLGTSNNQYCLVAIIV